MVTSGRRAAGETSEHPEMRRSVRRWRGALATVGLGAVGLASGVAAGASSGDATLLVQAGTEPPALLDYFTFIPQALLLLIAVGLRRYVLDEEDIPWWLDGDSLRARVDAVVPDYGQRLRRRVVERLSTTSADAGQSEDTATAETDADAAPDPDPDSGPTPTAPSETTPASNGAGQSSTASSGTTRGSGARSGAQSGARQRGRADGPVPDRLALGYGNQRIVVGDGKTVDEEIRAMLRAAGEGDHAKWIDDRHLHFIRDEHGFTLVVDGENPTRLNGERMRPGDRARVYPGDEIELSGVVALSVERA